jgi:hypothetical protein
MNMNEKKRTDTNSSGPIHLDMEQLEELDKLIHHLKKEVVVPTTKSVRRTAASVGPEKD